MIAAADGLDKSYPDSIRGGPMRQIFIFSRLTFCCLILLLPAMATAQLTMTFNYGSVVPPPGQYSMSFVPLVTTPGIVWGSALLQVGASNATAGNLTGAANATLSVYNTGPSATFAPPVWSGQARSFEPAQGACCTESASSRIQQGVQFGAAMFEDTYGVARLAPKERHLSRTTRIYTNADIARLPDANETLLLAATQRKQ
jgi:hypothetical protein